MVSQMLSHLKSKSDLTLKRFALFLLSVSRKRNYCCFENCTGSHSAYAFDLIWWMCCTSKPYPDLRNKSWKASCKNFQNLWFWEIHCLQNFCTMLFSMFMRRIQRRWPRQLVHNTNDIQICQRLFWKKFRHFLT